MDALGAMVKLQILLEAEAFFHPEMILKLLVHIVDNQIEVSRLFTVPWFQYFIPTFLTCGSEESFVAM